MNPPPPVIYRRTIDNQYRCVVRTAAGRAVHRGTQCRSVDSAINFALLLQRDIIRRAENGDLLPPEPARARKPKAKK